MHATLTRARILALALACLLPSTAPAQSDLPNMGISPALLSRGENGAIRLVVQRTVDESQTQDYIVQVPGAEQRVVGGRTVTVTVMRDEIRTRAVTVQKTVAEEIEVPAGQFDVRRASGEPIQIINSGARESRSVPAVVIETDRVSRPRLPAFYELILRPDTVVVFVQRNPGLAGAPAGPQPSVFATRPPVPVAPTRPPVPAPIADGVRMTVQNDSGQRVDLFSYDWDRQVETSISSLRSRQRSPALPTKAGTPWTARVGERLVSEYIVGDAPSATWRIGPPIDLNNWQGNGGEAFRKLDDIAWAEYDSRGRMVGKYDEDERCDTWVSLRAEGREMIVRLWDDHAEYQDPDSNGWQPLGVRTPGAGTPRTPPTVAPRAPAPASPTPSATNGSALSAAEIKTVLSVHNQARAEVGLPAVTWSDGMADYAQRWANKLASENKCDHRKNSPYGENLAMAATARDAVGLWYAEKDKYRGQVMDERNFMTFGHYTQMVWGETTKIGCGKSTVNGRTVWVCNYDPPGNRVGAKPY